MSGWRPALRIARRSVRRNLKRSILVAALIAVPIAGATVVDGLLRTLSGTEHQTARFLGDADGSASVTDRPSLPDWHPGYSELSYGETGQTRDPASVDLLGLLPPGSRAVALPDTYGLRLREGERIVRTELSLFAVGDPLTAQYGQLVTGRQPTSPTEALVTEPLAERLGLLDGDDLRRGATVTIDDGPTVTVTGVSIHPFMTDYETVQALPGSVLLTDDEHDQTKPLLQYHVDLPAGTDGDTVWPLLARHGVEFYPRAYYVEPERYLSTGSIGGDLVETAAPVALVVGFGLLEVVLLAGAAFAVGARRQVRELGLVGANGGTARHVRRIVLAQGLFLGVVGSLAGLVLGWVALVAGTPVWEELAATLIDGWRLGWIELTVAAGVGVASGVAAALVPAIGVARMRPADALAQRFRNTTGTTRLPILGVVLLGVGIAGLVVSGLVAMARLRDYREALESETLTIYPTWDVALPTVTVMVSALVVVAGMTLVASGLVGLLGRSGSRLPLSGRLALRDAGRHRHRTVPAVVAIMIVVTGSVTLAFSLASMAVDTYRMVPENTIIVGDDPATIDDSRLSEGTADVVAELPGAVTHDVRMVEEEGEEYPYPVSVGVPPDTTGIACANANNQLGVATPELIELVTGQRPPPAALAALADGEVLVTNDCLVTDGNATTVPSGEEDQAVVLPARHLPTTTDERTFYSGLPSAFISAEAAQERGWTVRTTAKAVVHAPDATQDQLDTAIAAAEDAGLLPTVETNDEEEANLISLALAAGAGLITLFGVGITVALSGAEGRADLATLAAIGAQPRRRRTLAGAQALVLSVLGTVLGLVFGGALGFAVVPLSGQLDFVFPWQNLAITVAVVPLLAVAVAMLTTRSRLPMVRRLD